MSILLLKEMKTQELLKECKDTEKEVITHITEDIEIFSSKSDKEKFFL